jgi:LCP family protein required for cell wall assembly
LTLALALVAVGLIVLVMVIIVDLVLNPATETSERPDRELTTFAAQPTTTPTGTPVPVPTATPLAVPATPPHCTAPPDWGLYVIQRGDSLSSLAQQHNTDVGALMRVNCLETDLIYVGQSIYLPGLASPPTAAATAVPTAQLIPTVDVRSLFPDRYVNIILLGSDRRKGGSTWRTDTMIVVTLDTEGNYVRVLSIPRDLWVYIPGHGYDRINTADLWGELARKGNGPSVVKQTINQNLGIPIHYYVRVDFQGFVKIVDAVGGVDVDVECPLPDIELVPGMVHMDGDQALLYARSRKSTNDFDRSRRQRKLLMALWEQALTLDIIPRLPALWAAMAGTFQTDLPLDKVVSLASMGLHLEPNRILSQSIGPWQVQNWRTPQGYAVLLPVDEEIQRLLATFYAPLDLEFLERIRQTNVQIVNGSQLPEAEQLAATSLYWAGFQVSEVGPALGLDSAETQIIVHHADQDVAEAVAMQLGAPRTAIQHQPDPNSPVDIQVILGWDYDPCAAK